jgi:hypothetical protein
MPKSVNVKHMLLLKTENNPEGMFIGDLLLKILAELRDQNTRDLRKEPKTEFDIVLRHFKIDSNLKLSVLLNEALSEQMRVDSMYAELTDLRTRQMKS